MKINQTLLLASVSLMLFACGDTTLLADDELSSIASSSSEMQSVSQSVEGEISSIEGQGELSSQVFTLSSVENSGTSSQEQISSEPAGVSSQVVALSSSLGVSSVEGSSTIQASSSTVVVESSTEVGSSAVEVLSSDDGTGETYVIFLDNPAGEQNFTTDKVWGSGTAVSDNDATEGSSSLLVNAGADVNGGGAFFKLAAAQNFSTWSTGFLKFDLKSTNDAIIKLEAGDPNNGVSVNLVDYASLSGNWESVSIPLSDFTGLNLSAIDVVFGTHNTNADIRFDNIRFYKQYVAPPDMPTALVAEAPSENTINLTWVDNATDETGYNIYWSFSNTKPTNANETIAAGSTSFTIENTRAGSDYYIWVTAAKTGVESDATTNEIHTPGTAPVGEEFVFLVIPDTQYMVMDFSHQGSNYEQFTRQMDWITQQKDALNIKFIAHLGDVVDHVDKPYEWSQFKNGWAQVENSGIPWAIAPGNHDTNLPMGSGSWDIYNSHYDATSFINSSWGIETYPTGKNENNVSFFEASGMEFMVISIGYSMDGAEYTWAKELMDTYPNKRVIVNTHDWNNGDFSGLMSQSTNAFLGVSGHYCGPEDSREFTNAAGIYGKEIMSDYQCNLNGYLRYYVFKPQTNEIEAVTYSPIANQYRTGPTSTYTWTYNMN